MISKMRFSTSPTNLIYAIIAILPFIQLGISYYVSVSFITFLVALVLSLKVKAIKKSLFKIVIFGAIIFILKAISLYLVSANFREIIIPLREMLCFIAIIIISSKLSGTQINAKKIRIFLIFPLLLLFLVVIIQKYFLLKGIYLGFPISSYIMNEGTLKGVDTALFYGTRFRPTSFYAEPSYTAWIVFSFLTIILLDTETSTRTKYYIILVCFLIVILSESFSGILALNIFAINWFIYISIKSKKYKLVLSLLLLFPILLFLTTYISDEFQGRIQSVILNTDASTNIRILDPIDVINKMKFNDIVFGVNNFSEIPIDNAGFGLFIHYGLLSLIIVGLLWKFTNSKLLMLYFFIGLSFNGSIFSFDKVLVISLVFGLSKYFSMINIEKRRNLISLE